MTSNNSSAPTKIITIVGGGFCGALTGVNILRQNPEGNIRIILIDRGTRLGRGLAYGTWDDNFLLNVPAGNMSAFPDDPNHFVRFCQDVDPAFNSATFASRRLYGDYLELTLRQASERNAGIMLEKVRGEAIAIRRQQGDDSYRIDLASGRSIQSGQVVLALGHFPPWNPVTLTGLHETGIYIANPWDFVALERANGEGPIAILGMGLTAVDTVCRLTSSSDTRKIYLVSRHGLFPQSHRLIQNPRPPQVFRHFSRICRQRCGPMFTLCVWKSGKTQIKEAIGATLSTSCVLIPRSYGNDYLWKSGRSFFLALSLIGIYIAIGSRQLRIYA